MDSPSHVQAGVVRRMFRVLSTSIPCTLFGAHPGVEWNFPSSQEPGPCASHIACTSSPHAAASLLETENGKAEQDAHGQGVIREEWGVCVCVQSAPMGAASHSSALKGLEGGISSGNSAQSGLPP